LENKFKEHYDSDLTLIVAGVQVIRDNSLFEEQFEWPSKEKIYNLITKYQKNNVVFLSGDVHYANAYHTPCEALTGYNVLDYTSSGMTHTVESWLPLWIPGTM
jgi:alkaline phosphatase D